MFWRSVFSLIDRIPQEFVIEVDQEPSKTGIDPLNKLIDKHPEDNLLPVKQKL